MTFFFIPLVVIDLDPENMLFISWTLVCCYFGLVLALVGFGTRPVSF